MRGVNVQPDPMHAQNFLESSLPTQVTDQPDELSAMPTLSQAAGDPLRHILLGSAGGVQQTIHLLHTLRYAETVLWSPPVPIPSGQLIITPRQGDVMSILVRQLR